MLDPAFVIVGFAAMGSGFRLVWGIYRAWTSYNGIRIAAKRIVFEFCMNLAFGAAGGVLMNELGIFKIGIGLASFVSGLLGANTVDLIAKRFGWSKKMDVIVSDQQLQFPDLNARQVNALTYVQSCGKITNKEYQRMSNVTRDVARYELSSLVEKKRLRKVGHNKGAYYVTA
jgi:hypothetical protein